MEDKNVEVGACKHEPRYLVGVLTVATDITCKKCGHKYYYKNKKTLMVITFLLWTLLSALYIYAVIGLFRTVRDRPLITIIAAPIVFVLYRLIFAFVARMIYKRFGKIVTVS